MAMRKTVTAYVVQRLSWEYGDDFYYREPDNDAPVLTFLDPVKAEAHRRECEWRHVRDGKVNPFGYADLSLEERTSLPIREFHDRLRQAGMDVEGESQHSDFWAQYDQLPEEGQRLVWDAVDRFRFFTVLELTVDLDE